jgi:hypothetical protein
MKFDDEKELKDRTIRVENSANAFLKLIEKNKLLTIDVISVLGVSVSNTMEALEIKSEESRKEFLKMFVDLIMEFHNLRGIHEN